MDSNLKGSVTELNVMTSFMENGYCVSVPYGNYSHYDFVADINDNLIRIQCKTAYKTKENTYKVLFNCSRRTRTGIKKFFYTNKDVDYFATFVEGNCYLFDVGVQKSKTINITNEDSKQYLFENVIKTTS